MSSYRIEEVSRHNNANDCWLIIDGKVYDVTKFLSDHPGGKKVLLDKAGKDATAEFKMFHGPDVMRKYGPLLLVGSVSKESAVKPPEKNSSPSSATTSTAAKVASFSISSIVGSNFGDLIPYGDPNWYQNFTSPYYNDSHLRFRKAVREWVDKEVIPHAHEWDENKSIDLNIWRRCYEVGCLPIVVGPPWPTQYVGTNIAGGVNPSEIDPFHELIFIDELARCGSGGVTWGLTAGLCIGLPPVMLFGSKYLQDKVCAKCLKGESVICLAITEPGAGSDVANLQCSATKTEDGKYYIVNGQKKWITNGIWADFFTTAVRTGGSGMGGISLLLIEKSMPGVITRQMKCSGVWPSGTTFISFENVRVPVTNLIGRENEGFRYIMYNFNHERWWICAQANRFARVCIEESMKYASKRETFGKKLIEHPVIRYKLAQMTRHVEASHAWIELITLQMKTMTKQQQNSTLGGPIALLKAQVTQTFEYCAREAAQIFGGLAYTRGGQGEKVERLYREVRAMAIPAGSEEIMLDLGIRQALKQTAKSKL